MEDGICDGTLVHQNCDAPADTDDKTDAQHISTACHKSLHQFLLAHAVNEANENAAHQKQGRQFREPPSESRQRCSQFVKGDDAVDHHDERACKYRHDDFPPSRKLHGLFHAGFQLAGTNTHHRPGWVLFHLGRISHDEPDGGGFEHHPLDQTKDDALSQRDSRKAGGNAGGKRVHC